MTKILGLVARCECGGCGHEIEIKVNAVRAVAALRDLNRGNLYCGECASILAARTKQPTITASTESGETK